MWKKWLVVAIVAMIIIAIVVLHLVQPKITYAFAEVLIAIAFIIGGVAGWLANKYFNEIKK